MRAWTTERRRKREKRVARIAISEPIYLSKIHCEGFCLAQRANRAFSGGVVEIGAKK